VTGRGRLPLSRILAQHRDPTYRSPPGRGRTPDGLENDHIRDVPDRYPRRRFCQVVASAKVRLRRNPSQYCDTALMRHTFRNECTEANLEPVSDTPTTCPVRFPLQPSCCLTACTDPHVRLASAYLGTQRTGPFRYRTPRATRRSKILCCCGTARNEPPDGIWSSP
jgi:hypothetical protein